MEAKLNLSVLVVDDNLVNRLLINKVLLRWGINADFAENGLQAIGKIESSPYYDVVLMDIYMPVMTGIEATRLIRARQDVYFKQVPIIGLTASVLDIQKNQVYEAGMNDFILKPFDREALYNKLVKYQKQ